jgi:hypothetical protein
MLEGGGISIFVALNGEGLVVMDFPSIFRVSCLKITKRVLNGEWENLYGDSNERSGIIIRRETTRLRLL